MKKILLALILCFVAGSLMADEATWTTSVPEAKAKAEKEGKLILLHFTGSDWCPWCKKLDAEVFSKPEFSEYAKKNLVLVKVDFPHHISQSEDLVKANKELKSDYKITGFPTLVLINPDGKVVWKQVGYAEGGPSAMIAKMDEARSKQGSS